MIFIELVRANEMSELENFGIFQFEKSHFQRARGLMTFIKLMLANGVSELENFGIFSSKRAICSMLAGR